MFLKQDIRQLNKQLELIRSTDTNARLTTETFDSDIVKLCNSINAALDERRDVAMQAERSNAEIKRAITNISHDLRTPLTSATGYLQMLINESGDSDDKTGEYLNIIKSRLDSLTTLMNSLFEYAQIIEGKHKPVIERVNICNLLQESAAQFYNELDGFEVRLDIPEEPLYAHCDMTALNRAVRNLIKNAVTHGYGLFELALNKNGKTAEIVFRNRVRNMEALDVERMFDRFYTGDLSRSGGNTGLGLAITKELIESTGGNITAEKDGDMLIMKVVLNNLTY